MSEPIISVTDKVKLAFGIISGRIDITSLSHNDWANLGYDPYAFISYAIPDEDQVKSSAEDIIIAYIQERRT